MTNEQISAARGVLNRHPELKVAIGRVDAGEVLTPYFASDVFARGDDVVITANMSADQVASLFAQACVKLKADHDG